MQVVQLELPSVANSVPFLKKKCVGSLAWSCSRAPKNSSNHIFSCWTCSKWRLYVCVPCSCYLSGSGCQITSFSCLINCILRTHGKSGFKLFEKEWLLPKSFEYNTLIFDNISFKICFPTTSFVIAVIITAFENRCFLVEQNSKLQKRKCKLQAKQYLLDLDCDG